MEDGGKGAKTFDVALGTLAGNALSAVIGKCGELMEQTKELRRDLSFLEQNARDAGMGMEQLHNKAGELYAVTGDTNEVVEALSNILATGFDDADKAYEAVDLLAGAVVKFPETMKIESLADSLQETIATGEATGQFSALLGRLGVDVEKFNERLGRTRSEACLLYTSSSLFTAPSRKSCCAICAGALPPPDRYRPAMNTNFCWQKALRARTT